MGRELHEPTQVDFASEADFKELISGGRSLHHMRSAPGNVTAKTFEPGKRSSLVVSLAQAQAAMNVPGTYLMLFDPGALLAADVSNLKGFRDNTAKAFEMESNKALARDELLRRTYGKLQMLNDGRGVTFSNSGSAFLEIDGVIVNSVVALINEAKSSLHVGDVKTASDNLEKLKMVIANPHLFDSEPEGVLAQLRGLRLVPVVSGKNYSAEAKALCAEKHVHLLETDGSGFRCTLHDVAAATTQ